MRVSVVGQLKLIYVLAVRLDRVDGCALIIPSDPVRPPRIDCASTVEAEGWFHRKI